MLDMKWRDLGQMSLRESCSPRSLWIRSALAALTLSVSLSACTSKPPPPPPPPPPHPRNPLPPVPSADQIDTINPNEDPSALPETNKDS